MPASPADSAIYAGLLGDRETSALFSDSISLRSMLLVEGALARVQGRMGLIPAEAADFIDRAASEVQIDPAALSQETARNGVPVPALIAAFRKATGAPDMLQYLHWGATSQDIMDTAEALRLRRVFDIWQARLSELLRSMARLAETHADLPMAARTYGQYATPTSFGGVVAGWGWPLLRWQSKITDLRAALCQVSLSGAAGTGAAFGPRAGALRAELARELGLADAGHNWHSDRAGLAELAGFAAGLAASLGKMADDIWLGAQSGVEEITLAQGGGSSTMPQKQNPVGPSAMLALARHVQGLAATLHSAGMPRGQRDGAAWFTEWLVLPQLCIALSRMLSLAVEVLAGLSPNAENMARALDAAGGAVHAEAASFALAAQMPRVAAQAAAKSMVEEAQQSGVSLRKIGAQRYPNIDWAAAFSAGLGQSPAEARAFSRAVQGTVI